MTRFAAAVLIFAFFWAVVGPVCVGMLTLFALATGFEKDISAGANLWTVRVGSLFGTFLGLFFAARRIRKNAPWKLTPLKKSAIFGCVYYVAQALWLLLLFAMGGLSGPPSGRAAGVMTAVDFVVRFPASLFSIDPKTSLTLHYAGLFAASFFWAAVFYLALRHFRPEKKLPPSTP